MKNTCGFVNGRQSSQIYNKNYLKLKKPLMFSVVSRNTLIQTALKNVPALKDQVWVCFFQNQKFHFQKNSAPAYSQNLLLSQSSAARDKMAP